MRYKTAPGPVELVDLDTLGAVHAALPLVPGDVDDCCARVVDRTAVPNRDDAREWITFLQALGLAEETPRGYRRVRADLDERAGSEFADRFERGVFGVPALLAALDDADSLPVQTAFERFRTRVPAWERDRHADWEGVWSERVRRLLAWCAVFGLATRDGDRYRTER
jgi:hypothetical protein